LLTEWRNHWFHCQVLEISWSSKQQVSSASLFVLLYDPENVGNKFLRIIRELLVPEDTGTLQEDDILHNHNVFTIFV
jgi:hypothetical protein